MDQKRKRIFIVILAGLLLVVTYFGVQHFLYVSTDNAQIEARTVMLAPKISGFIRNVNVIEGQRVKKSDLLLELDPRDYENALHQLQADFAGVGAKRADAEKNFKRLSDLYARGAVSQQQLDATRTQFEEIRSRSDALAAQVAQAELNLENTKMLAPFDAVIAKKAAEVGQLAAVGQPILALVETEGRWVTANFKETEIKDIKPGAKAEISVDSSGQSYEGEVESLSPATGSTFTLLPPDNATGNFTKIVQRVPVRIRLKDIPAKELEEMRAGLSVVVKVRRQ